MGLPNSRSQAWGLGFLPATMAVTAVKSSSSGMLKNSSSWLRGISRDKPGCELVPKPGHLFCLLVYKTKFRSVNVTKLNLDLPGFKIKSGRSKFRIH